MSERVVQLKVKLDDKEVVEAELHNKKLEKSYEDTAKAAESSANRMQAAANKVGDTNGYGLKTSRPSMASNEEERQRRLLAFMGKDVPQAAAKTSDAMTQVSEATAAVGSGFSTATIRGLAIVGVFAAVAAAVALVAYGAYKLGQAILDVSKKFADYAIDIGNVAEETGLATETISALRHEAEAQGRSFSDVQSSVQSFRKTVGEAAAGSLEARASLKLLGIDGTKAIYDIDGAFRQALSVIAKAPDAGEQIRLAFGLGPEAYKLIPFLKEFQGNVDGLIGKAEELGIIISGKDVAAAREFNRAYADVEAQVKSIALTFGREFGDTVKKILSDFGQWLTTNKDEIKSWAVWTADWIGTVVNKLADLKSGISNVGSLKLDNISQAKYGDPFAPQPDVGVTRQTAPLAQPDQKYYAEMDIPSLKNLFASEADLAALEAKRAEELKQAKAALELEGRQLDAKIELASRQETDALSRLKSHFDELKKLFVETGNGDEFEAGVSRLFSTTSTYLKNIDQALKALEDKRAKLKNLIPEEVATLNQGQHSRTAGINQQLKDLSSQADQAFADVAKKQEAERKRLTADELREAEAAMRKSIELFDQRESHGMEEHAYALRTMQISDQQYLDFQKQSDLDILENRKKSLTDFIGKYTVDSKKRAEIEGELAKLDDEITQQKLRNERLLTAEAESRLAVIRAIRHLEAENADPAEVSGRRNASARSDELSLKQQITGLNDAIANAGINDALQIEASHLSDILGLRNRERDTLIEINRLQAEIDYGNQNDALEIQASHLKDILDLRHREVDAVMQINRAQLELDHAMDVSNNQIRAKVLDHLAQQKTMNEAIADGINGTYDAVAGKLDEQIDKMFKFAGVFKSLLAEPFKAIARNTLTNVTRNILDQFIPGLGAQLTKTNNPIAAPIVDKLDETNRILRGIAGGGLAGRLGSLVSGGASSGAGNTLGALLKSIGINGSGARSSIGYTGSVTDLAGNVVGTSTVGNQASGGLSSLFSAASLSSLFASAGQEALASLFISSLSEKSLLKGALKGGLVGFVAATINRSKLRRQEETTRNQGMLDAQAAIRQQFDDLISQVRFGADPVNALTQAANIGSQVRTQYLQMANALTDKKTRNIAIADVSRVDSLIAQKLEELKGVAALAQTSADRAKRILPEFAGGVFISQGFRDFQRVNGMLSGSWTGRDYRQALLADAEMVLNPSQQNNVRRAAGFDVFAGAGIPNYPNASPATGMASGGVVSSSPVSFGQAPSVMVQNNFTLIAEDVSFGDKAKMWVESDDGSRSLVTIIKKKQKSGDI